MDFDRSASARNAGTDLVPQWCNVLDGFSDDDLAEFDEILNAPVILAHAPEIVSKDEVSGNG